MINLWRDFVDWFIAMRHAHLNMYIVVWARMFPLPQFVFGSLSLLFSGPTAIGTMYLYSRAISFVIAGQIYRQHGLSKRMGPIMHIPLIPVVWNSVWWLRRMEGQVGTMDVWNWVHFWFVLWATLTTVVSYMLDAKTMACMVMGTDPGMYPVRKRKKR